MNDSQTQQNSENGVDDDPRAAYRIQNPLAISRYLAQSVIHGDLYTVSFRGKQFLTCLLEVDTPAYALVFDSSQIQEENKALIDSVRSHFRGQSDGVRVEFELSGARPTQFEGRPALTAPLPSELFYIQRREFFRINTPVVAPFRCSGTMLLSHGDERAYDIEIHDISLSGIGLRSPDPIEVGTMLPKSQIDLQENGKLNTDLRVVNCKTIELANLKQVYHIGCIFEHLKLQQEILLQRYITQAEKELAVLKGSKE